MLPSEVLGALTTALFLVVVVNKLVDGLALPLFNKFGWDKFWLMYVAWFFGAIVVYVAGINLFVTYIPNIPVIGRILTALVAGGGANLLHDIFDK